MPRLIEVQDVLRCASPLSVSVGDVLFFRAAGGHVRSANDVIEMLGAFRSAVMADDESIVVTPQGPPDIVLFRARKLGQASIDLITGDPFNAPQTAALDISVEA